MSIPIRQLDASHRPALLAHFAQLSEEDRRLRFGLPKTDALIAEYVGGIDFERDTVLGVFGDQLELVGVAHVARGPYNEAEFGVSVLQAARGRGIGSALFERANAFARNHLIRSLYVHCLTENKPMIRIARKAGMRIVTEAGEADAHLELPPANVATITEELVSERVALFDFALKAQLAAARSISDAFRRSVAPADDAPK